MAQIFYLQSRAHWQDRVTTQVEHSGSVEVEPKVFDKPAMIRAAKAFLQLNGEEQ